MRSVLMGLLAFATTPGPTEESPRVQYEALVEKFDAAYKAPIEGNSDKRPQPQELAPRFFALADKYPEDPVAIDALTWVASKYMFGSQGEKALGLLARDYSRSENLKTYCSVDCRYGEPYLPYEELLRAVLKNNSHREVRARACVALAVYLKMAKETTEKHLVGDSQLLPRSPESLANFNRIKERGLDKVAAESAALFEEVIERYGTMQLENLLPNNAGEFAKGQLFELRNLGIGAKSPGIEGRDISGKAIKLSDYRGKVIVLDFGSHRSCGVCRQMYPYLRDFVEHFRGKPVALLAISVDDNVNELKALYENGEITWPMLWDGEREEGPLAAQWVIRSMPTFYVLDHRGVIRNKGFLQPDQIRGTVEMLLKEMSPLEALIPSLDAQGEIRPTQP